MPPLCSDHTLTFNNDGPVLAALHRGLVPVIRFACYADMGTHAGWAEALEQLEGARRAVAAARAVESGYRDMLRAALVLLEDHARAVAIVLARKAEGEDDPALETARQARGLATLAGEIAGALGVLAPA